MRAEALLELDLGLRLPVGPLEGLYARGSDGTLVRARHGVDPDVVEQLLDLRELLEVRGHLALSRGELLRDEGVRPLLVDGEVRLRARRLLREDERGRAERDVDHLAGEAVVERLDRE